MLETVGLLIFASLFILSGITHIRDSDKMVEYTTASLGKCPVSKVVGFMGGIPTGVFLIVVGTAAVFSQVWAFYALAGFLAVVTAMFHRNLKDPVSMKTVSLLGAALYIASQV